MAIETIECKRCGWCCEHVIIKTGKLTKDQADWARARNILQLDGYFIYDSKCKFLIYDEDGLAICLIHTKKPKICANEICKKPHVLKFLHEKRLQAGEKQ
jgi:Fe-S-cluster containining protein